VEELVADIKRASTESGAVRPENERYVIPPHLHDLQEAELPEAQRGLVISEIAQFRERAAIREREKSRELKHSMANMPTQYGNQGHVQQGGGRPAREWGRPQVDPRGAVGGGPQGYDKTPGFVPAGSGGSTPAAMQKSDEQLEAERKEQRRRDEENSFRDVSYSHLV
jgi:RNA-binding protein 25